MTVVNVRWIGKGEFVGTDSTRHSMVMSTQDEAEATGLKPSDVLLLALGGCTGVDVVSILEKQRQHLRGLEINISAQKDSELPRAFRKIHIEYLVRGDALSPHGVERAIKLSKEKYCSVGATISGVAEITTSFRIVDDDT